MARNKLPIAVAGGGIGGLAAALALAQKGFASEVLEQVAEFGEAGVGLQVAPNALSALDALGVGDPVKRRALLIERMVMFDTITGSEVVNVECGERFRERFGNPYAVAHRADVHGALLEACRAHPLVSLRTHARVTHFEQDGASVRVFLQSGETLDAQALIGADGIRSTVRQACLNDGPPEASGAVIFRAVIPAGEMPKDLQQPYPSFWAGPNSHVIYYPVRDWSLFNFGATVVTGETERDESTDIDPGTVRPLLEAHHATVQRLLRIPKSFRCYVIRHRRPVENWTRGRVTLLGDAAHPMVQYIAQGAAMALEDAVTLAACADRADDLAAAMQAYQTIRIVRTARVQISSLMMHYLNHASGVERLVRNSLFEGRSQEDHYERLAWLYTPPEDIRRFRL
ncbi:MAG: 3-hydroxybenzoate 6-monooxygenase [Pseudorhodoplanes sp.]